MNDPIFPLRDRLARRVTRRHEAEDPSLRERVFRSARRRHQAEEASWSAPDGLQILTGKLLLFTALGTTMEALADIRAGGPSRQDDVFREEAEGDAGMPVAWAPAVLGPLAAIAHVTVALRPSERNRTATRLLDVAVMGAGLAALAGALGSARRRGSLPSLTSVALASAGALGLLLDRREREHQAEISRLEKRAALVDKLVPRRRPKLDRIVLHV